MGLLLLFVPLTLARQLAKQGYSRSRENSNGCAGLDDIFSSYYSSLVDFIAVFRYTCTEPALFHGLCILSIRKGRRCVGKLLGKLHRRQLRVPKRSCSNSFLRGSVGGFDEIRFVVPFLRK